MAWHHESCWAENGSACASCSTGQQHLGTRRPSAVLALLAIPWALLGAGLGGLLLGGVGAAFGVCFRAPELGFVVAGAVGVLAGFTASLQLAGAIMRRRAAPK
jgi:hypothetical protein